MFLFADHPTVQHPDPSGLAVFGFHPLDHVLHRGLVGGVSIEYLVADRKAFGCDRQTDVDLVAVRPLIARIAACRLLVGEGLPFEIRAGDIVKQELKFDAEPALITLVQMLAKVVLGFVQQHARRGEAGSRWCAEKESPSKSSKALSAYQIQLRAMSTMCELHGTHQK